MCVAPTNGGRQKTKAELYLSQRTGTDVDCSARRAGNDDLGKVGRMHTAGPQSPDAPRLIESTFWPVTAHMTPHPASAPLPTGWCIAPPLAFGLAAAMAMAGEANMTGFVALNQWARTLPDGFWAALTDTASVLSAGALLALCLNVAPRAVVAAVLAWPAGIVMVRGLKYLIDAPRPHDLLAADTMHQIGVTLSGHSFPSGHTATAFTLIAALILTAPACRRALPATLLLLTGALVGLSRIAVGAHWPGDVLAGAAVGWLSGLIGAALSQRWPLWRSRRVLLALVAAGIVVCLARVFIVTGYPQAQLWSTALGLAGLVAVGRALKHLPGRSA